MRRAASRAVVQYAAERNDHLNEHLCVFETQGAQNWADSVEFSLSLFEVWNPKKKFHIRNARCWILPENNVTRSWLLETHVSEWGAKCVCVRCVYSYLWAAGVSHITFAVNSIIHQDDNQSWTERSLPTSSRRHTHTHTPQLAHSS